jgi:hypothetical protein
MLYDPGNPESRQFLASSLIYMLHEAEFREENRPRTHERVFSRAITDELRVAVYTTIDPRHGVARGCGRDAIRVCLLRKCQDGRERGLGRQRRVNRVGDTADIVQRTLERMRACWGSVKTLETCERCNAPKFKSKKGNLVCSDLCWL